MEVKFLKACLVFWKWTETDHLGWIHHPLTDGAGHPRVIRVQLNVELKMAGQAAAQLYGVGLI